MPDAVAVCDAGGTNATHTCRRDLWHVCDLTYLECALPVIPWIIFVAFSIAFARYTNVWAKFHQGIDDLHDIPAQALGIVVARQKRELLGRKIPDPRRIFMLTAMWAELPGFSYLPLELMYYQRYGHYMFVSVAVLQVVKFAIATTLLLFILVTTLHKRLAPVRVKLLYPLVFDALFVVLLYAIVDVLTCAAPVDRMPLGGTATCACRDRIWLVASLASVVFAAFYAGALAYRIHLSEDVFGVRFRYPMSFSYLMTAVRTGSCLLYMTMTKLLESSYDVATISVAAMSVYLVLFASLFRYNYRLQPCLGSGLFPNNLRALSFATACWSSLAVIVTTYGTTGVVLPLVFVALYPFGAVFLWRVNSARARQYHIQNQSLTDALKDPNLRVRTVAIVSITLEDHSRWKANEITRVVKHLQVSLAMPGVAEDGLLVAYACQAVWHLCCQHCKLNAPMVERPGATDFAPFNLWVAHRQSAAQSMKSRHSNAGATTRLQELVDRKAETNTRTGISTVAPVLVADGSFNTITNAQLLKQCLEIVLQRATSMLTLPFPKACNVIAKLLQEMYVAQNVQLTLATWLSVVCTLCGNYNQEVAAQAATSLCATIIQFDMAIVLPLLCDPAKLTSISQLLVAQNAMLPMELLRDRVVAVVLARTAAQITRMAPVRDPIHMYTPTFVANMTTAWRLWQAEYSMTLALESVFALMQKAQMTWRAMTKHKLKQKQMLSSGMMSAASASRSEGGGANESLRRESVVIPAATSSVAPTTIAPRLASWRSSSSNVSSEIARTLHGSRPPKPKPKPAMADPSPSRHPSHNRPDRPNNPVQAVPTQHLTKVQLVENDPSRRKPGRRRSLDAVRKSSKAGPKVLRSNARPHHPLLHSLSKLLLSAGHQSPRHGRSRSFDHRRRSQSKSVHAVVKKLRTNSMTGDSIIRNLNQFAKGAGHDLVAPFIWREIKLRRAVRLRLMAQVTSILVEGLPGKLLPQLFTPTTAQALHALVAIIHAYPIMTHHLAHVLHGEELRYITFVKSWQEARSNPAPSFAIKPRLWTKLSRHLTTLLEMAAPSSTQNASTENMADDERPIPLKAVVKLRSASVATLQFPGLNFITERRRRVRHPARHSTGR